MTLHRFLPAMLVALSLQAQILTPILYKRTTSAGVATSQFSPVHTYAGGYIASGSTSTITGMTATGAAHGIVVVVQGQNDSNSASGCTDSKSDAYTKVTAAHSSTYDASTPSQGFIDVFYTPNAIAGVTSVSCTFTTGYPIASGHNAGGGDGEIFVYELNQIINAVDQVAVLNNQYQSGTSTHNGASVTTTNAYTFIVSGLYLYDRVTAAAAPWTVNIEASSGNGNASYSPTSIGTYTPTFTANASGGEPFGSSTVAFK